MPVFEYSLQYAEFDFDEVAEKGPASPSEILAAFDSFPWTTQAELAATLQKCSPTITVSLPDGERLLWVSPYCKSGTLRFYFEYRYPKPRSILRSLLSFASRTPARELSLEEARLAIQLFLEARHDELVALTEGAA